MKDSNVNVVELSEVDASINSDSQSFLNQSNIDLISEMPVQLNIEIGGFSITVEELYQLKPGMVMPIGTKIDEPVKICLGDNVVAEGILVASEEQYAIEVTNVAAISS